MKFLTRLAALSTLLALAGCNVLPVPQADAVRYFTLSGPVGEGALADAATLRPVQLAGHLRGRSMAVRVSENEVIYLDAVRWAEPLDEAIGNVLRRRLCRIPGRATVSVQVQRCELERGAGGNSVGFAASYTITSAGGEVSLGSFKAAARTWDGVDHGMLVTLLRDAVNEFAGALASAVTALPEKK
jgi:ABC-type transport auxiliary lipoprotein component